MSMQDRIDIDRLMKAMAVMREDQTRIEQRLDRMCRDLSPVTRGPGRPKKEPEAA